MNSAIHLHDISDHVWILLAPLLPGRRGARGGQAKDNRLLSTQFFGVCGHELHGEIFHQNMATGKILIVVFVVGVITAHGSISLQS